MPDRDPQSPHHVTVGIGLPDRGKIGLMWCVTEEGARELIAELTARFGERDHEFLSDAEAIDIATRELFNRPGAVIQVSRDA